MKTKEIYKVLGVPPATLFDWSKPGHKKEKLALLLKQIDKDQALLLIENNKQKKKPLMLLSTVNCSIGDKSKHFTLTKLKNLFYKKEVLDPYEIYALKTIKREAFSSEIDEFTDYYNIPTSRVEKVLAA